MSPPRKHTLTRLGIAAALMLACEDPGPGVEFEEIAGTRVDYRYLPELEPCAGNVAAMDGFVEYGASAMKIALDDLPRISFSWLGAGDLVESWTEGACSHSCADGTTTVSVVPIFHHELAHALIYGDNHRPAHFLAEGFATALDSTQLANFENVESLDPRGLLTDTSFSSGYYPEAGFFVVYLIQVYGPDKFRALYKTIPRESSLDDWDSAFQSIYKQSIDALVEDYLADADCPDTVSPFPQFECEAPLLAPEGEGWEFGRVLDCGDDDVFGGIDAEGGMATAVTFEVEEAGAYDVDFAAVGKSLLRIGACDRCRWLQKEPRFVQGQPAQVQLEAGRHSMIVRLFETEPQDVRVTITPAP